MTRQRAAAEPSNRYGTIALTVAALLFSTTFLVVKGAVEAVSPWTFLAGRFTVGALVLAPLAWRRTASEHEVRHGLIAGGAMLGGFVLQTYGLRYTTSARSAFLTYMLVVIVPLIESLILRRRPRLTTLAGGLLAVLGLALLTSPSGGGGGLGLGEVLTIGCAVCFASHIVILGRVAPSHDPVRLTFIQLVVVALCCAGPALGTGLAGFDGEVGWAVIYTGAGVTALAFVLMVGAQRVVPPSRAALLLLIEPVAAALLGVASGEHLGWLGAAGAGVILGAIWLSERAHEPSPETVSAVGTA